MQQPLHPLCTLAELRTSEVPRTSRSSGTAVAGGTTFTSGMDFSCLGIPGSRRDRCLQRTNSGTPREEEETGMGDSPRLRFPLRLLLRHAVGHDAVTHPTQLTVSGTTGGCGTQSQPVRGHRSRRCNNGQIRHQYLLTTVTVHEVCSASSGYITRRVPRQQELMNDKSAMYLRAYSSAMQA